MAATEPRIGLRERKKRRTRESIVRVATRLFATRGYDATTIAEIAEEAEVAPSTLFTYFPTKADLVFSLVDAATESARARILGRADDEPAVSAIVSWIADDLPEVESPYVELVREFPGIVASNEELQAQHRLRLGRLEDVLAAAFARDLGEPEDGLRTRTMAGLALHGMVDAWSSWYEQHASDEDFELEPVFAVKAEYVRRVLDAGREVIAVLPRPD